MTFRGLIKLLHQALQLSSQLSLPASRRPLAGGLVYIVIVCGQITTSVGSIRASVITSVKTLWSVIDVAAISAISSSRTRQRARRNDHRFPVRGAASLPWAAFSLRESRKHGIKNEYYSSSTVLRGSRNLSYKSISRSSWSVMSNE